MKILIITNNVKNHDALNQGLQIAKDHAATIGINLEYSFQDSPKQFTGMTFNNPAVGSGACVRPEEILAEVNGNYKIACLIFDWDKVSPKPTNPAQSPILKNGCNPIQIPENWYNGYPDVLSDYLLHEICHSGYYFANNVAGDQTHAYIPEFSQKQRWEYYIYLLTSLKPFLEQPVTIPVIIDPLLRKGDRRPEVSELQKILKAKGFYTYGFITGYFGIITEAAVKAFQKSKGLYIDGVVGAKTWQELKKKSLGKLDQWAMAIQKFEGYYPGSVSYRNNNPGNLKLAGQPNATGKDNQGHAIFPTYEDGWNALINQLKFSVSGKSKIYSPTMTLQQFFTKYAEGNQKEYAAYVAKFLGVPVTIPIGELL